MPQNNNFAYHFEGKKSYLAWYRLTTSQCRLTWTRREDSRV